MGIQQTNPFTSLCADTFQARPSMFSPVAEERRTPALPAEWEAQSGVQLTWPHARTDWAPMLEEVTRCFVEIARQVAREELLLIVTPEPARVTRQLYGRVRMDRVRFLKCDTNDTWARDHGAITLTDTTGPTLLHFRFNAWGGKFAWQKDNEVVRHAHGQGVLRGTYADCQDFVLEGGSIESDGCGTLLTTSACLLNPNRNPQLDKTQVEERLKKTLHLQRVLWLDHGHLQGDDTDSHIDTLARFCSPSTIAYVQCDDPADPHHPALQRMERQLRTFRTADDRPYRLLPLPLPRAIVEDGERLPATYANFLIMNESVLMPTYGQPDTDRRAQEVLQEAFPGREVRGIDCRALIKQHGSLHCVTMQYPPGVMV